MKFYEKLRQERKKIGITQKSLGDKLNVSAQTIAGWENESSFPKIENLVALSEIFCVTTDYLLKDELLEPGRTIADGMTTLV